VSKQSTLHTKNTKIEKNFQKDTLYQQEQLMLQENTTFWLRNDRNLYDIFEPSLILPALSKFPWLGTLIFDDSLSSQKWCTLARRSSLSLIQLSKAQPLVAWFNRRYNFYINIGMNSSLIL
jgi:hypothetical protein